ncbi:MAG: molybdenum cofactor guanylyltransferase [Chloroflexota bacterium]
MAEAVTGLILAGGRGSRLNGADKAALDVGGRAILARVCAAIRPLTSDVVLVVNEPPPNAPGVRLVYDPAPHAGVLPALLAGLDAAAHPLVLTLACDMPFVSTDLCRRLLGRAADFDAVISVVDGREQPLHAVYRRDACAPAIAAAIQRQDRRLISFLRDVRVDRVEESWLRALDPELRSFFNVNTPDDLTLARCIAATDEAQ